MSTKNLGRLHKVDLREAWTSESIDFTPWLAQEDNLKLLGEVIGIELELESQEKEVGPFRADILCKNTANDSWVLIGPHRSFASWSADNICGRPKCSNHRLDR
jgi:hypothetical protein